MNTLLKLILITLSLLLITSVTRAADTPTFVDPVVSIDAAYDAGRAYLLIGTKKADKAAPVVLQLTTSDDDGKTWSAPQTIDTSKLPLTPRTSRGNDARIAARNGRILIAWTQPGYGAMASGPLAGCTSSDSGKTWTTASVIYQTSTVKADEHGARFPAITATDTGFHIIWIDAKGKERALGYSSLPFSGQTWAPARILEPEMCACCWNTFKTSPQGHLYALYRDVCPSDMGLLVSRDNGLTWTKTAPPGGFNWTIDGCPHTGGSLAFGPPAKGPSTLYSTVWTGKDNVTGGYFLSSTNDAKSWSDPTLLNKDKAVAHHTTIATDAAGEVCVAYDAPTNPETGQYALFIAPGNQAPTQASPAAAKATHPIALGLKSGFLVFWTQQEGDNPATLACKRIEPKP